MTERPIFSESRWKPVGIAIALIIGFFCILLVTGCVSQPDSRNTTANSNETVIPSTLTQLPVPTQCIILSGNFTPYIIINPIGTHTVGDVFEINGTTNLAADKKVKIYVDEERRATIDPHDNPELNYTYSELRGYITIRDGFCGINPWSYPVNLTGFHSPKLYFVNVFLDQNHSVINYSSLFIRRQE